MTLATHAVVGGSVAVLFPSHPVVAFFVGFFSHFILDAIPHWGYKIHSAYVKPGETVSIDSIASGFWGKIKADKYFGLDLCHTGVDVLLGVFLAFILWMPVTLEQLQILSLGIFGGVLPDFLTFVYARFPHQPFIFINNFHRYIHADKNVFENNPFMGILTQVVVAACVVVSCVFLIQL